MIWGNADEIQLWRLDSDGEERKVEYLCTMVRHTQTVNVVRWAPRGRILRGESLASTDTLQETFWLLPAMMEM
jgi:hypothetical protein